MDWKGRHSDRPPVVAGGKGLGYRIPAEVFLRGKGVEEEESNGRSRLWSRTTGRRSGTLA